MIKKLLLVAGVSVLLITALTVFIVFQPAAESSGPVEAVPLVLEEDEDTPLAARSSTLRLFSIVPTQSEARFLIDEVLRGEPKNVVGVTDQVAGQIAVDPADLSTVRLGVVTVGARGLQTDDSRRNNTIANRILNTGQYEEILFEPREILGLPAVGNVGELYHFQVVGDLTIRDSRREVLFDVTLTPLSETTLAGSAQSTIRYADFGIAIPSVPFVASVGETVKLEIEFVAEAG